MARPAVLRVAAVVAVGVGAGSAACEPPAEPSGRLLALAPASSEVVVAVDPARVAGTWLDDAVSAPLGDIVPRCVVEAARRAALVVVAWAPDDGAVIAMAGVRDDQAAGCEDLERRGRDRVWSTGVGPAARRDDGFFADRERRQRWGSLPDAPVKAVADLALAAGLVVRAGGTADPRDGLEARLRVTTDDRETSVSLRERYLRWRGGLDAERLGGAWPAIAAITTAVDRADPLRTTDLVEVKLPGAEGATTAALAIAALSSGLGGLATRLPCAPSLGDFIGRAVCAQGELTLTESLYEELAAEPSMLSAGITVVPTRQGTTAGLRLGAVSANDPAAWLGFENGDTIEAVDGEPLTAMRELLGGLAPDRAQRAVEIGVVRRGRRGTLRLVVR